MLVDKAFKLSESHIIYHSIFVSVLFHDVKIWGLRAELRRVRSLLSKTQIWALNSLVLWISYIFLPGDRCLDTLSLPFAFVHSPRSLEPVISTPSTIADICALVFHTSKCLNFYFLLILYHRLYMRENFKFPLTVYPISIPSWLHH